MIGLSFWIMMLVTVLWYIYQLLSGSQNNFFHVEAHVGYLSGLPEPYITLAFKYCPQLLQLSYLIPLRRGPRGVSLNTRSWPIARSWGLGWVHLLFSERVAKIAPCQKKGDIWAFWKVWQKHAVLEFSIPWRNSPSFLQRKTSHPGEQRD